MGGLGLALLSWRLRRLFWAAALCLKDVASCLGTASWEGFRLRCAPLAASLEQAEAKLLRDAGGSLQPVDWVGFLSEPRGKLQSFWSAKLQERRAGALMGGCVVCHRTTKWTCARLGVLGPVGSWRLLSFSRTGAYRTRTSC